MPEPQATRWLTRQRRWLLPTPYFLATFTLPAGLRLSPQKLFYRLLFQTAAAALHKLALDPRFVGGQMGMMAVLHTWTRTLGYHPHLHFLIPGGGITPKGRWRFSENNFFLPAPALSPLFPAQFRDALKKTPLFASAPPAVWKQAWVVHCQPAGQGETVLQYFAPYIYRVALVNRRLLQLEKGQVTRIVKTTRPAASLYPCSSSSPVSSSLSCRMALSRFAPMASFIPKTVPPFRRSWGPWAGTPARGWPNPKTCPGMKKPPLPLLLPLAALAVDRP